MHRRVRGKTAERSTSAVVQVNALESYRKMCSSFENEEVTVPWVSASWSMVTQEQGEKSSVQDGQVEAKQKSACVRHRSRSCGTLDFRPQLYQGSRVYISTLMASYPAPPFAWLWRVASSLFYLLPECLHPRRCAHRLRSHLNFAQRRSSLRAHGSYRLNNLFNEATLTDIGYLVSRMSGWLSLWLAGDFLIHVTGNGFPPHTDRLRCMQHVRKYTISRGNGVAQIYMRVTDERTTGDNRIWRRYSPESSVGQLSGTYVRTSLH